MIRKAAIFRTIGVLGDSLASGEFEYDEGGVKGFWDCYEHSWGKYIAREIGSDVTIFARGGLTAHALYHDADEKKSPIADINRLFDEDNGKQAYIIALGVNDLLGVGNLENLYRGETGDAQADICPEDYTRCRESYIGTMGKIIVRLKAITPRAKFFLVSMPDDGNPYAARHLSYMQAIAARLPDCYVVDLYHKPPYDHAFHQAYYCGGHMNAMGYIVTADLILDEMDAIISRAPLDFTLCQFAASGKEPYAYTQRSAFQNGAMGECRYLADTRGRVINAFGGGILYADGAYHRYGLSLRSLSAEEGGDKSTNGIAMYRSKDLYNWENEGIVLPLTGKEDSPLRSPMKLDSPTILYNQKTKKYVLWCHYVRFPGEEGAGEDMNEAAVAVSDNVNGPYAFLGTMRPIDGKTPVLGLTAFQDADGQGYLILDRLEDSGRRLAIVKLSDDGLSVT
ncbi:MAG: family 43 glycosylhydrolase [Clostridia bacterium]|nr:family 43 glycosylhydrolase [Clostridia bacterium]